MPTKIPTETTNCPDCGADVLACLLPVQNPTVAHAFFGAPKWILLEPTKVIAIVPSGRDHRDARVAEAYRRHACPYDDLPKDLENRSDRELALKTAFEIVHGAHTHHLLNLARCHIEVASTKRMPDAPLVGLRAQYPVPPEHERLGSWCPDCGPNVAVDEDGCCSGCGNGAIGPGADDALRALRFATEHEDKDHG